MKSVTDFVNGWVSNNINAQPYMSADGDDDRAASLAAQCEAAAKEVGITRQMLERVYGDLESFMEDAIDDSADQEVARLVGKDD